jgi:phosphoglycolate phosphatase-like HAD superfamily hydrolase
MNTIILSDFSKTMTDPSCPTTWSVFAKSGLLGEAYKQERDALYENYFKYETASDVEKTREWWKKHGELFVKYELTQELIRSVVADDQYFKPRAGLREFLNFIMQKDIPVYIVTSGIKNFVDTFFEVRFPDFAEWLKTWKWATFGNRLVFDHSWTVVTFDLQSIVTPLSKETNPFWELIKGSERIILLWDSKEDRDMFHWNNVIPFGFTDGDFWVEAIKLWKNGSFVDLLSVLKDKIV